MTEEERNEATAATASATTSPKPIPSFEALNVNTYARMLHTDSIITTGSFLAEDASGMQARTQVKFEAAADVLLKDVADKGAAFQQLLDHYDLKRGDNGKIIHHPDDKQPSKEVFTPEATLPNTQIATNTRGGGRDS